MTGTPMWFFTVSPGGSEHQIESYESAIYIIIPEQGMEGQVSFLLSAGVKSSMHTRSGSTRMSGDRSSSVDMTRRGRVIEVMNGRPGCGRRSHPGIRYGRRLRFNSRHSRRGRDRWGCSRCGRLTVIPVMVIFPEHFTMNLTGGTARCSGMGRSRRGHSAAVRSRVCMSRPRFYGRHSGCMRTGSTCARCRLVVAFPVMVVVMVAETVVMPDKHRTVQDVVTGKRDVIPPEGVGHPGVHAIIVRGRGIIGDKRRTFLRIVAVQISLIGIGAGIFARTGLAGIGLHRQVEAGCNGLESVQCFFLSHVQPAVVRCMDYGILDLPDDLGRHRFIGNPAVFRCNPCPGQAMFGHGFVPAGTQVHARLQIHGKCPFPDQYLCNGGPVD